MIEQVGSAAPPKRGKGLSERVLYELILDQYREYVGFAEEAEGERTRGAGDTEVENQFEKTKKAIYRVLAEVLAKLDDLERRNPSWTKVDITERQMWQHEIKNRTRKKPKPRALPPADN